MGQCSAPAAASGRDDGRPRAGKLRCLRALFHTCGLGDGIVTPGAPWASYPGRRMAETSELLTVAAAARLAGVSERTMRRWAASGQVRTVGRGHARRIPASEVVVISDSRGRVEADNRMATAVMAEEAGHLAALVRELQARVTELAGAAGMWQARALMLEERVRALEAPHSHDAPESPVDANLGAEPGEPTAEPSDPPAEPPPLLAPDPLPSKPNGRSPWWRRLVRWVVVL